MRMILVNAQNVSRRPTR